MSEVLREIVHIIADSIGEFINLMGGLPWSGGGQSMIWIIELGSIIFILKVAGSIGSKIRSKKQEDEDEEFVLVRRKK